MDKKEKIKAILEKVYGKPVVDENATFEQCGGTSVIAMKLQIELMKEFGVKVPFGFFYENGSLASLVNFIK